MLIPMKIKASLFLFAALLTALRAEDTPKVKWHPGHYIYVGHTGVTREVVALPHFRGVQKVYTWRQLEPEKGRYDFSGLRADLALVRKHQRQLVAQVSFRAFAKDTRAVPDYLTGAEYGGGVYRTRQGSFGPVIWNANLAARFDALLVALGREFDRDPNLEAVNLAETAPSAALAAEPQAGVETYTEELYFEALKRQMLTLRRAFPGTVVIQYTNFPPKLLGALTDFEKEIGMGMGGPDVYPRPDAVSNPEKGIYRLYTKLAGTVPLGAAVQRSNYSVAYKKRAAMNHGTVKPGDNSLVIQPGDETPIPVREHLQLAQEKLKLNYLFWSSSPEEDFARVVKMLAEPDLANDPAGGLEAKLPPKAFLP